MIPDWQGYLAETLEDSTLETLRAHVRSSRPLGGESFVARLEVLTGQNLRAPRRGRKPGGRVAARGDRDSGLGRSRQKEGPSFFPCLRTATRNSDDKK